MAVATAPHASRVTPQGGDMIAVHGPGRRDDQLSSPASRRRRRCCSTAHPPNTPHAPPPMQPLPHFRVPGGLPAGRAHRRRCPPPPSSTPFADVKPAVRGSGDGQPAVAASCPSPPPRSLPTAIPLLPHDRRRPPPANGRRDRKIQPPSSSPPPAAGRPRQAGSPVATADSPPLHHRQTGARLDMPHSRLAPTWELRRSAVGRRRLQALTTACHMRRPGGGEGRASHAADLDGARVESDVTSSAHSCHRPQAAGPGQATE